MKRTRLWILAMAALAVSLAGRASDAEIKERPGGTSGSGRRTSRCGLVCPGPQGADGGREADGPDDPAVHYNMWIAYERRGFTDEAVREFQKAIALKADYAEAHNYLGTIQLSRGLYDEPAAPSPAPWPTRCTRRPRCPCTHGAGSTWPRATCGGLTRQLQRSDPEGTQHPPAAHPGAEPRGHRLPPGGLPAGEGHLQKSVERALNPAEAHHWLGMTQMQLRKRKEAAESFRKVIQLAPDSEWGRNPGRT